ncbi:hypothetical protein Tco_0365801 [Tanacetum coccineum]
MPSESPLIKELDKIKVGFEKLSLLIQQNCKRASIFYTSPAEIEINDFCQDQVKPILNELKMEKLEDENVSLDFTRKSLIKERDNAKMEYTKLFDSIKKTRSQTQKEMDELIVHVSEKTYAYGAIRAENQNLLTTIYELKKRLEKVEKEYYEQKSSYTPIYSAAQPTQIHEDSPSTSSIIVDTHEAPPVVTTSDEQTSPISLTKADEFNQEDTAEFDGNAQFVPYNPPSHEEIESSTTSLVPSNVHNFHQVQPSTHIWTKDHPLAPSLFGDPSNLL